MYKDGELSDGDIYANLIDVVAGTKGGRASDDERVYWMCCVGETSSMTRQVWIRKTNASEPPVTRREPVHAIETDGG